MPKAVRLSPISARVLKLQVKEGGFPDSGTEIDLLRKNSEPNRRTMRYSVRYAFAYGRFLTCADYERDLCRGGAAGG